MGSILDVRGLYLHFNTRSGVVKAVDGVSITVGRGETLALIGESGCGKSSLARALIRLLPRNIHAFKGQVILDGEDVMTYDERRFREEVRWLKISMVMQAAQSSLNPVIKVGDQVAEPLTVKKGMDKRAAMDEAVKALTLVGIPQEFAERYPFELSGGMRQRAVIAMALITRPQIVILDEPTSALDVLTQTSIMNMLKEIKGRMGLTYIFITHDVATSSELADKVAVMYAGQVVEVSPADKFYPNPLHPYSAKLMATVPTLRADKKLEFIPGTTPSLIDPPKGCRFAERCHFKMDICVEEPPTFNVDGDRLVKCWIYGREHGA
ncbi:MAG: ABC transporter ATP-binding protein [Candidatus Nezhaarchaeota archaeon]|nr:ABC transporter ATP-binding protein [Candidatus Nezhaarchaeota archaeon]